MLNLCVHYTVCIYYTFTYVLSIYIEYTYYYISNYENDLSTPFFMISKEAAQIFI